MGPAFVVLLEPFVGVRLKVLESRVQALPERDAVELLLHSAVEAFADAIGLRRVSFGLGMIDVLHREIELILMMLAVAAVLRPAVRENAQQRNALLLKEGQHAIVQHIGGDQSVLAI